MSARILLLVLLCLAPALGAGETLGQTPERPNILWLVSEDNGPFIGAYGDDFATTPHLDALAAEGFLYTHAYANAPVCAPARSTIITGLYANSGGNEHMRSEYPKSDVVEFFPHLDGAALANDDPDQIRVRLARRHEIDQENRPLFRFESGLQDQRIAAVAAGDRRRRMDGRDLPSTVLRRAEERGEARF